MNLKAYLILYYIMNMPALNNQTDRELRQLNRNNKRNIEQQSVDREKRVAKRNELRSQVSVEVSNEIKLLVIKAESAKVSGLTRTRSGRMNSFVQ